MPLMRWARRMKFYSLFFRGTKLWTIKTLC